MIPGIALLFRGRDAGRVGKIWVTSLVLVYWALSTPIVAVALVGAVTPDFALIRNRADARGATAIVVLGSGLDVHRSRGGAVGGLAREGALRVLEAARLFQVLDPTVVLVSGGYQSAGYSEAGVMADQLRRLGVPAARILTELQSTNTRDHARYVPAMLERRGIDAFVLVTSQQHMGRALAAFRAVGQHPVPAAPEVYVARERPFDMYLPSKTALSVSEHLLYEAGAWLFYLARGWV